MSEETAMTETKPETDVAVTEGDPRDNALMNSPAYFEEYAILDQSSGLGEVLHENLMGEPISLSDLKIAGFRGSGSTEFKIVCGDDEKRVDEIVGIVVCRTKYGVIWGSPGMTKGKQPVLETVDMETAYLKNADIGQLDEAELERCKNDDGTYRYNDLKYSKMGSEIRDGEPGPGKWASEGYMFGILIPDEKIPILLRVPAASIPVVKRFNIDLPCKWSCAIVRFTAVEKTNKAGTEYPQLKMEFVDRIQAQHGDYCQELFGDMMINTIKENAATAVSMTASEGGDGQDEL